MFTLQCLKTVTLANLKICPYNMLTKNRLLLFTRNFEFQNYYRITFILFYFFH